MDFLTCLVVLALMSDQITARRLPSETSTCPSVCTESRRLGYEPGQSYEYSYEAQTISHVTGTADQAATLGFTSDVTVKVLNHCEFLITFKNVRTASENANELSDALTRHPLQASWQDGDVTELCSHNNDPKWVLNLKRGFLSTLQNSEKNQLLQTDVNGDCMMSYDRTASNDGKFNIKKTNNLNNCVGDRFQTTSAILFSKYEADSSRKSLFDSNQECNQTWSAMGVLEQSTCVETHLLRPFSYRGNGAETTVNQNIRLVSTQSFTGDNTEQLTEHEIRRTTIKFEHEVDQNTYTDKQTEIITSLENVCDLLSNNAPPAEIPSAYLNIVIALKFLNEATIQTVWNNIEGGIICPEQKDKIRQMFLDAVPMCTSSECIKFSVSMINSDVIEKAEKRNWMSAFSSISNPSEEIIEAILPLLQTTPPMTEAFLTTGTLIYRFCSDKNNCLKYIPVSQAIDILQEPLGSNCHTTNEDETKRIILSLRSLGNAGLSTSGRTLSACVVEQRNTVDVRLAAMSAYRRMPCDEDRSGMRSVFSDVTEDSEIRISSYLALMKCPNLVFVRHLMSMLENEEVNQVGSFIWSHIMEVKSSADPLKSYIQYLLAGTKLTDKFSKDKRKYSSYYEKSVYSETLNLGSEFDGDLIWSSKSFMPRSARLNLTIDVFGAAVNLFEIGGRAQGLERELERIFGPAADDNSLLSTILGVQNKREKRSAVTKYDDKVSEIQTQQSSNFKEEKPSGQLFLRMFGNEILYKSIGSEITETSGPQSWFGGFRTLLQLATTGSEYSIRNSRLLIDSQVIMPSMVGLPLNLKVTGTSSVDVSIGGQLDIAQVLLEGFNIQGHLRPKAAVEVLATMTSKLGDVAKAGLDLQTRMASSMDINGTISLVDGQNFRLKIDAPQEKMDVFNYKSNIFVVEGSERSKIVPSSDVLTSQWCSETGFNILGVQICSETTETQSSNLADDTAPLFPLNGNLEYMFDIRKTDPLLTHYLIETQYSWEQMEGSVIPQVLTAHFFVGTPGSVVNRDSQLDLVFSANQDDINIRVATSQKSIELIGNRINSDTEKSVEMELIIDDIKSYKMAGTLNYEKSRIGGHIWDGNAYISTPDTNNLRPTITGKLAYLNMQQFESSIEVINILAEPITLQVDLETLGGEVKSTYTGNALIILPGYFNFNSNLRSSSNKGDDKTQLSIRYSVLDFEEETIKLSHKYKTANRKNGENWSISTDVSFTQFPSLNHKISLKHKETQTGYDSSMNIGYGTSYSDDNNTRRIAIKQIVSNLTNSHKTNLEGSWSLDIPEYNIDYRATLAHIYDWNREADKVILLSGSFRQSKKSEPLSLHLRVSDQSTSSLTHCETEGILSTPWGELSALQRLNQIGEGRYDVFGNYGLGKAVGLQVQLVANITNVPETKHISVHVYRPQSPTNTFISEDEKSSDKLVTWSPMKPSDVFEDIAILTATLNIDNLNLLNTGDYHINAQFELESRWNDKLSLAGSVSKATTGSTPQILTTKRFDVTFTHPTKELRFYTDIQQDNTNSLSPSVNSDLSTSTLITRFEWTDDSTVRKHFAISNKFDRLIPKTDTIWETEEKKFSMKFQISHNVNVFTEYISPEFNIDLNLFSRPISDNTSYNFQRAYGITSSMVGPTYFSEDILEFSKIIEIKFNSLKHMSAKCKIAVKLPFQIEILGVNLPIDIAFTNSMEIDSNAGIQFSSDSLFDSQERFYVLGNFGIENSNRYVFNLNLKQNLQKYFKQDILPKDMKVNLEFENSNNNMELDILSSSNDVVILEANSNIDYDNNRISIRATHNIPLLSSNHIPSNFQVVARKSPNVDFGGSFIMTSDSVEILTARLSISRSTANENQQRCHLTVEHDLMSLKSFPRSSEIIVKFTNLLRAFEITVQTAIDDATSNSNFMIQLPTTEFGFNINIDQTHDVELLLRAGVPTNSKFNLAVNENNDAVDVIIRIGEQRLKVNLGFSEEVVRHSNKKRSTLEVDLSNNIDVLTSRNIPLRFKTTLRAECDTAGNTNSMTSVYSFHMNLEDEIFQTSLSFVQSSDNNIPVGLEVRMSLNHDMQRLRNSDIPSEVELLASMQKMNSGFNVRTSTSYGDIRKHFDISVYSENMEDSTRYVAEIEQNLEIFNQLFNLPSRTSITVDVVPVSLYFGFNIVGLLDLGNGESWRISTALDGNSTSLSYMMAHELSIPSIVSQGYPANLQLTSNVIASTEDKLASLDMQYIFDDENKEIHFKLTSKNDKKSDEETYQINIDHTFEMLTLYNIPLSTQVVLMCKVIDWTYAKGDIQVTADDVEKFFRFHSGYRYDSVDKEYKLDYAIRHNLADDTNSDSSPVKIRLSLRTEQPQSLSWDIGLFGERFRGGFNVDVTGLDLTYSIRYNFKHTIDSLLKYGVHKKQEFTLILYTGYENTFGYEIKFGSAKSEAFIFNKVTYTPGNNKENLIMELGTEQNMIGDFPNNFLMKFSLLREGLNKFSLNMNSNIDDSKTHVEILYTTEMESYQYLARQIVQINRSDFAMFSDYIEDLKYFPTSAKFICGTTRERNRKNVDFELSYPGSRSFQANFGFGKTRQNDNDFDATFEITNNAVTLREFGIPDSVHGGLTTRFETNDDFVTIVYSINIRTSDEQNMDVDITYRQLPENRFEVSFITNQNFAILEEMLYFPRELQSTIRLTLSDRQKSVRVRCLFDDTSRFIQLIAYTPGQTSGSKFQISRSFQISHDFSVLSEEWLIPKDIEFIIDITGRQGQDYELNLPLTIYRDLRISVTMNIHQSKFFETSLVYQGIIEEAEITILLQHESEVLAEFSVPSNSVVNAKVQIAPGTKLIEVETVFDSRKNNIAVRTTNQVIAKGSKREQNEASFSINHDVHQLSGYIPFTIKLTGRKMIHKVFPSFEVGATLWIGRNKFDITSECHSVPISETQSGFALRNSIDQDFFVLSNVGVPENLDVTTTIIPVEIENGLGGTLRVGVKRNNIVNSLVAAVKIDDSQGSTLTFKLNQDFAELVHANIPEETLITVSSGYGLDNQIILGLCFNDQCIQVATSFEIDLLATFVQSSFRLEHRFDFLEEFQIPRKLELYFNTEFISKGASVTISSMYNDQKFDFYTGMNISVSNGECSIGGNIQHSVNALESLYGFPLTSDWKISYTNSRQGRTVWNYDFNFGEKMMSTQVVCSTGKNPTLNEVIVTATHSFNGLREFGIPNEIVISSSLQEVSNGFSFLGKLNLDEMFANVSITGQTANGKYEVNLRNQHNFQGSLLFSNFQLKFTFGLQANGAFITEVRTTQDQKTNLVRFTSNSGFNSDNNTMTFMASVHQDVTQGLDETSFWSRLASKLEITFQGTINSNGADLNIHLAIDEAVFDIMYAQEKHSKDAWSVRGALTQSIPQLLDILPRHTAFTGDLNRIQNGFSSDIQLEYNSVSNSVHIEMTKTFNEDTRRDEIVFVMNHDEEQWVYLPRQIRITLYMGQDAVEINKTFNMGILCQFDQHQTHVSFQSSIQRVNFPDSNPRSSIRYYIDIGHDYPSIEETYNIPQMVRFSMENTPIENGMSSVIAFVKNQDEKHFSWTLTCGVNDETLKSEITLEIDHNIDTLTYVLPTSLSASMYSVDHSGWSSRTFGCKFVSEAKSIESSVSYILDFSDGISLRINVKSAMAEIPMLLEYISGSIKTTTNVQIFKKSILMSHEQIIDDSTENFILTSRLSTRNKQLSELSVNLNQNLKALKLLNIPSDSRIMFSYGTNSEPRSTISMDVIYGSETAHATIVTSILEDRMRLTVVFQQSFQQLYAYNVPDDIRIAGSSHWSANSLNVAFEYSFGDTGSQRGEVTLSSALNKDENNRMEVKLLFDQTFNILTALSVPSEASVLLFYSSPNVNSHYTGVEIDVDLYSINLKTNVKARSNSDISKFDLTVRGRQNVPYLLKNNFPKVWRSVFKVSTQERLCSISLQSRADGVEKTVLEIKSTTIWTSEITNLQLNASYDISDIEQYVSIPTVGDIVIHMESENIVPKKSVLNIDFGHDFLIFNYKSEFRYSESNIWFYNSEYDFKQNIEILSIFNLPKSGSSKVSTKLGLQSSSISMDSKMTQDSNSTPTEFRFGFSFDTDDTTISGILSWNHSIGILNNVNVPTIFSLHSNIEVHGDMVSTGIVLNINDTDLNLLSDFGAYQRNKYGLKSEIVISSGFVDILPRNIMMEGFVYFFENQFTGFGYDGKYGDYEINGNTTWNFSMPSCQVMSLLNHNIGEIDQYLPNNVQFNAMMNNENENNVSMVLEVITPSWENQFNIAVAVQENVVENNRQELVVSVNHSIPVLGDLGMPNHNKLCLHKLIQEISLEVGIMLYFDEKNLVASFAAANPNLMVITVSSEIHHNFESLFDGGKMSVSSQISDGISLRFTLLMDGMLEQLSELNITAFAGKPQDDIIKYNANIELGHNIDLISTYVPFSVTGNAFIAFTGLLVGQVGMKVEADHKELLFTHLNMTTTENSITISNSVRYLDPQTKEMKSYSSSSMVKCNIGTKYSATINVDMMNSDVPSSITGEIEYHLAIPNLRITANFSQNNEYLIQNLQLPELVTGLIAIQLPTMSDFISSASARLTIDKNQPLVIESFTNVYVDMPGSNEHLWGKLDAISIFQHNIALLDNKAPNNATINLNIARNGLLDADFNFDWTSNDSKKYITISTKQTIDENNFTKLQLNISQNISEEEVNLSLDLSGKLLENNTGFSYSINQEQSGIKKIIGEISYSTNHEDRTQGNQFSFKHSLESLKECYIPSNFELSASTETQDNEITIYSYNWKFDGITNTYSITISPILVDVVITHDWVTLNLLTGFPYSTRFIGKIHGNEYPFKQIEVSYTGDLQELKFAYGVNKQTGSSTEYNIQGDISHNMKTWEILGMPMKNNINIIISTNQNKIEINSVTSVKDRVMSVQVSMIKGNDLSYIVVMNSNNNISKFLEYGYPDSMSMRSEISSTTDDMLDGSLVFSINKQVKLQFKLTANHQSLNWPETGSLELISSLKNNLEYLTRNGIPTSADIVLSLNKMSAATVSGTCDITVDDSLLFTSSLYKMNGSAFTVTVGFGDSYSIKMRDFVAMNSDLVGINLEADFGSNGIMNSFGFRYDPTVLMDASLTIQPAALPQLAPMSISLLFIKNEDNITSGNAIFHIGNETLKMKLENGLSTFVSNKEWSVAYSAEIFTNITVLTENLSMPELLQISEGTYVNSDDLETPFRYELVMTQGHDSVNMVTANVNVRNVQNDLTESILSVNHQILSLTEFVPLNFEIVVGSKFEFNNQSGWVSIFDSKYSSTNDSMAHFSLKAAIVSKFNVSYYTFEVESSHKNIEILSRVLPNGIDQNNTLSLNFSFNDVNENVETLITNIEKQFKFNLSSQERKFNFAGIVRNCNTGEDISRCDVIINSQQDILELQDFVKEFNFAVKTVSYSDRKELNSILSWINFDNQQNSYNITTKYGGSFPSHIYDSHSLEIIFSQMDDVDTQFHLNWDLDLSEVRTSSDLRMAINNSREFRMQGLFDTAQPGVTEVDFMVLEPNQLTLFEKLEISGSLTEKSKKSKLQGRIAVDDIDPTLIEVSMKDLTNSRSNQFGKDFTITLQPGLVSLMWPEFNKEIFAKMLFEKMDEQSEIIINGTIGHMTLYGDLLLDSQDNYITITTNIQNPFKCIMICDLPTKLKTNIIFDARNEQRISTTLLVDSDELDHNILLTGVLMQKYLNTVFGFESSLRTSNNSSNDMNFSFKLDNNTYGSDSNYTLQIATYQDNESISFFFNGELSANENNKQLTVDFNQFGITLSSTNSMDFMFISVKSPIFDVITMALTKTLNQEQSKYSMKIEFSKAIGFESFVLFGDQSFTLSSGFTQEQKSSYIATQLSLKWTRPFWRLQVTQNKNSYDVIMASATMLPNDWLQLGLSTDKTRFQSFVFDLDYLLRGIENYYDIIEDQSTTFATKISSKFNFEQMNKFNYFMTKMFEFFDESERILKIMVNDAKQASQFVKDSQIPKTKSGVNQQVENLIRSFGMPIDNLKEVYYETFINQLKNDVNNSILTLIDSFVQTKLEMIIVDSINEIINHNLDNLGRKVYSAVSGSIPPLNNLFEIQDELYLVTIPTVYNFDTTKDYSGVNAIRDWLAGTLVTTAIKDFINYSLKDNYYRFVAARQAESSFPFFSSHASVINGKQIVTFDGKVIDMKGLKCAHLLSHDFLDKNFSLIMQRSSNNAITFMIKTQDQNGQDFTLQIGSDNTALVNGDLVTLPFNNNITTISRHHTGVSASIHNKDIKLFCTNLFGTVCHLHLGSFYFGRVNGLMGTMDNENYNDMLTAGGTVYDDGNMQEGQDTWGVSPDSSAYSCGAQFSEENECLLSENCEIFSSYNSPLRFCFPVLDPEQYLKACQRLSCSSQDACALAQAYRMKCKTLGAVVAVPDHCSTCSPKIVTTSAPVLVNESKPIDTVFVIEIGDCVESLMKKIPRLLQYMEASAKGIHRFGLVTYNSKSVQLLTMTNQGELFGSKHNFEKRVRRIDSTLTSSGGNMAMMAVKEASLFPFEEIAKKNVILMSCSNCDKANEITVSEMSETFNSLGISFHILKDEVIKSSTDNNKKHLIVGYDNGGAYTKNSLRSRSFQPMAKVLKLINFPKNDECALMLPYVTDGSIWNVRAMAKQSNAAGKTITEAVSKKLSDFESILTPSGLLAESMCRDCRCVNVAPNGLSRSVCTPC